MQSKLFVNTASIITPTFLDLLSCYSQGDYCTAYLSVFELTLSSCLRDDILEKHELFIKTEKLLNTHKNRDKNRILSEQEFFLWIKTYEQIMREEGLVGNTGNDDQDRESLFIDPFLSPFIKKKGSSVSFDFDEGEIMDVKEEIEDNDRIESISGGESEEDVENSSGIDILLDSLYNSDNENVDVEENDDAVFKSDEKTNESSVESDDISEHQINDSYESEEYDEEYISDSNLDSETENSFEDSESEEEMSDNVDDEEICDISSVAFSLEDEEENENGEDLECFDENKLEESDGSIE